MFVSSKVKKDQKAPLTIALRGFTGTTLRFVRETTHACALSGARAAFRRGKLLVILISRDPAGQDMRPATAAMYVEIARGAVSRVQGDPAYSYSTSSPACTLMCTPRGIEYSR